MSTIFSNLNIEKEKLALLQGETCNKVKKIRAKIEKELIMTIYQYEAGEGLADTLIITDADARNIV